MRLSGGCLLLLLLAGCELMSANGIGNAPGKKTDGAEAQRLRYQSDRDGTALKWLLSHAVHNGMDLEAVNHAMGEDGTRELRTDHLIKRNPAYRTEDHLYRYGPDKTGHTYYLAFRDGRLVNFDPKEYRE